jgi:uncharacterized membrane protein YecN with MAPEG domain
MVPIIVPAYAAVLTFMFILLSARVIRMRQTARIGIGPGGNSRLERLMRVHANFAEYVPLALLLLGFVEMQGNPRWLLHALCLALVAGRVVHAIGVSQEREDIRLRIVGVTITFAVLAIAAVSLLGRALAAI